MHTGLRPNRVQKAVCREAVAAQLGVDAAEAVLAETGISGLPDHLPDGPRDLATLARELQPFVDLYRAVMTRAGNAVALSVARQCIVRSAAVGFSRDAEVQRDEVAGATERVGGLNLTSPPPPGFRASAEDLQRRFEVAMGFFSCEGRLIEYTPARVRFHVTGCNWVRAMQQAGAPELIRFFCESDERFMDGHPTHRLDRPTAIGLGDTHCDFQFVPKDGKGEPASGGTGTL